jgi:hypothetical protein
VAQGKTPYATSRRVWTNAYLVLVGGRAIADVMGIVDRTRRNPTTRAARFSP